MMEILSDQQRQAEQLCQEGIDFCEEQKFVEAHEIFLKAYQGYSTSPKINSWLGYTTSLVERKVQKGLDLCKKAIDSHIPDAYFYRNIGKVYLLLNNKRAAIGAFAKGLQIDKTNRAILQEWRILGFRRRVAIPFLPRENWLNKFLGKSSWWLFHKKKNDRHGR